MVSVARGVAICEHKLSRLAGKLVRGDDGLVEQRNETTIIACWAVAGLNTIRVRNVFVVSRATVQFTVPAAWEEEFETDTIGAVSVKKVFIRERVAEEAGLIVAGCIVETVETEGAFSTFCLSGVGPGAKRIRIGRRQAAIAFKVVTGNHLKANRKSFDFLLLTTRGKTGTGQVVA